MHLHIEDLICEVIAECEIDTTARRFPKPDVLISIFSLIENTGIALEELLEDRYPYFEEWAEEIARVEVRYRVKKRQINSMDFDDLLVLTLKLLQENEELRGLNQTENRDENIRLGKTSRRSIDLTLSDHRIHQ